MNLECSIFDEVQMIKKSATMTSQWRHEVTLTYESHCEDLKNSHFGH